MRTVRSMSFPFFAQVSELKKQTRANAMTPQISREPPRSAHANAFVHGIQDSLRTRLGAHPHFNTPRAPEGLDGLARHQVAARLHAKGKTHAPALDTRGELARPLAGEAEDVVGEP
jgi:hypothetical protein